MKPRRECGRECPSNSLCTLSEHTSKQTQAHAEISSHRNKPRDASTRILMHPEHASTQMPNPSCREFQVFQRCLMPAYEGSDVP